MFICLITVIGLWGRAQAEEVFKLPEKLGTLSLSLRWNSSLGKGGSRARADLVKLLGHYGTPKVTLKPEKNEEIWNGIYYLMPVREVLNKLKGSVAMIKRSSVNCPGFPTGSFYSYNIKGIFEDGFTRLLLVTDLADQIVAIQLVDEKNVSGVDYSSASEFSEKWGVEEDWSVYNFVQNRRKATSKGRIRHEIGLKNSSFPVEFTVNTSDRQRRTEAGYQTAFLRIDSLFIHISKYEPILLFNQKDLRDGRMQKTGEGEGALLIALREATAGADISATMERRLMDEIWRNIAVYHKVEYKILERVRLYLPKPIVDLILYRIMKDK